MYRSDNKEQQDTQSPASEERQYTTATYVHRTEMQQELPKTSRHELKLVTMGQLVAASFKQRLHLLKPWLREQESCMVYAATGVGKSLFALSAAIAIAGRTEFLGWEPEEKPDNTGWRVLYIDGEMHIADIQDRGASCRQEWQA